MLNYQRVFLVMWVISNPVQSSHLRAVKPCETSNVLEARFSTPFFKHCLCHRWHATGGTLLVLHWSSLPHRATTGSRNHTEHETTWDDLMDFTKYENPRVQEVNKMFMWFGSMGISQLSEPWFALVAVVASYLMYLPPCPLLFFQSIINHRLDLRP